MLIKKDITDYKKINRAHLFFDVYILLINLDFTKFGKA